MWCVAGYFMMGLVMLGLLGLTTTLFKAAGRPGLCHHYDSDCAAMSSHQQLGLYRQCMTKGSRSGLQLLVFCYGKLLTVW